MEEEERRSKRKRGMNRRRDGSEKEREDSDRDVRDDASSAVNRTKMRMERFRASRMQDLNSRAHERRSASACARIGQRGTRAVNSHDLRDA